MLRDNQDLLAQFPGVADRLNGVVGAARGVDQARLGPLGQIAGAGDTTAAAGAVLPRIPVSGSAREHGAAAAQMAAQDAGTTKALLRQNVSDRYSKAATETQEANREFAGAKFHKEMAGNAERQALLDAVFGVLPGAPAREMNALLDVLQATGRRKPIGSATAFNSATMANDLGAASPLAAAIATAQALGTNVITRANDAMRRRAMQQNLGTLADLFTDPNSVELIQQAIARGPANGFAEAIPRTLGQVALALEERRQPGPTRP